MIPKPQPCTEEWMSMKPVCGGRMCSSCEKVIVDFRKKKWKEIEDIQTKGNNEVCGLYSAKQLNNWGRKKGRYPFLKTLTAITASFLSSEVFAGESNKLGTFINREISKKEIQKEIVKEDSIEVRLKGKVLGRLSDGKIEPLIFAKIALPELNKTFYANMDGNFDIKVKVPQNKSYLQFQVIASSYDTFDSIVSLQTVNEFEFTLEKKVKVNVISFRVKAPLSKWQRFKAWLRKVF